MKTNLTSARQIILAAAVALASCLTACTNDEPNGSGSGSGSGGANPDQVLAPDPAGVISFPLYYETGDNIDGIYYGRTGMLESTNGWLFCNVGRVANLGSILTIPWGTWSETCRASERDGIVAYKPSAGFVRLYVASVARNEQGAIVGILLSYLAGFAGLDEAVDLSVNKVDIGAEGGEVTINVKNTSYIDFQAHCDMQWCRASTFSTTSAFVPNRIKLTIEPNTTDATRTAVLTVSTYYNKRTQITITQAAE